MPSRSDFPKDHYKERKAKDRVPTISCRDNGFVRKLQNRLAQTFTYFANFEFLTTRCLNVQYFSKLLQCICLCGLGLTMHVSTTRLPICVSDCKGNQSR
jgi:hypothetical protein